MVLPWGVELARGQVLRSVGCPPAAWTVRTTRWIQISRRDLTSEWSALTCPVIWADLNLCCCNPVSVGEWRNPWKSRWLFTHGNHRWMLLVCQNLKRKEDVTRVSLWVWIAGITNEECSSSQNLEWNTLSNSNRSENHNERKRLINKRTHFSESAASNSILIEWQYATIPTETLLGRN